jgi:hypothetical protein
LRAATFQELIDLLSTYDMNLPELNFKGKTTKTEITKKVTNSQAVTNKDLRRAATAAASKPAARLIGDTPGGHMSTSSEVLWRSAGSSSWGQWIFGGKSIGAVSVSQ